MGVMHNPVEIIASAIVGLAMIIIPGFDRKLGSDKQLFSRVTERTSFRAVFGDTS